MNQDQLSDALRSMNDERPIPEAPIEILVQRGRRARRRRRAAVGGLGTGAVALALAAAITLADGVTSTGGDDGRSIATGRGSDVGLVAATEATARTTFRVKLTWTLSQRDQRDHVEIYHGAFDAANRRGYLRGPGSAPIEWRFIGDETYLHRGKWRRFDRGLAGLTRGTTGPEQLTADPGRLLRMLGTYGKVTRQAHSGSGAAAVETYTFTHAARPAEGSPAGARITGTITIGVASRKIQKIVQTTVIAGSNPGIADREPVRFTSVTEFSDYGIPVHVVRPPM